MRKKLKDVCMFYSGTGFPIQYQGQTKGEYPFYKVGDIANNAIAGKIYLELCNNYISSDVAKMIKGCILPKDTVVFAKIGEALKLNRRAITSCDCLIDNNAMGIAPKLDFLRIQYFYFCMKNLKMQTLAESTTVPSVRKTVLEKYEIEVPSLVEQEEIEKKLTLTQKIIEKRRQELSYLDEIIKARFVEMFGDENNSKNWDVVNVEEVADVQVGVVIKPSQYYTDKSEGVRTFRSLNIGEGFIKDNDWVYFTKEGHQKNSKSILKKDDLLIVRSGAPGTACVVTEEYAGCNAVDIIIVHPDCKKVNPYYLCTFTNMPHGKKQIDEGIGGAAQQHFNVGKYNKLQLMLPPKTLQDEFVGFIKQVDKSKFDTMTFAPIYAIINLYLHTYFYQGRR